MIILAKNDKSLCFLLFLTIGYANYLQAQFFLSTANLSIPLILFFILAIILICLLLYWYNRKQKVKNEASDLLISNEESSTIKFEENILVDEAEKKHYKDTTKSGPIPIPNPEVAEWIKLLNTNANELIDNGRFSITDLAKTMNLSERQFRRKLKQHTKMLPIAFMREIRLQKAKQLLESGKYTTVAEVCLAVGFSTPKHFSKLFQERFNKRPSFFLTKDKDSNNT